MYRRILLSEDRIHILGITDEEKRYIEMKASIYGCVCFVLVDDGTYYDVSVEGTDLYYFMADTLLAINAVINC